MPQVPLMDLCYIIGELERTRAFEKRLMPEVYDLASTVDESRTRL